MNIARIKQTQLHKDILEVFGSMANAARILGFHKTAIYKCAKRNRIPEKHIPRFIKGFDDAEKNLTRLRKILIGKLTEKDIKKLKKMLGVKT